MPKGKRWTSEEDTILVQAIKANPHNKLEAFRLCSKKIGKSSPACSGRWYNVLSNPKSKHYVGCIFTMIGNASHMINRSVQHGSYSPTHHKVSIWAKIKRLLGL